MRSKLRRQLWTVAFVVLGVVVYRFGVVPLLRKAGAPGLARPLEVPDKGAGVRVVSWNLHNFVKKRATAELAAALTALDADILVLQEIRNPTALKALVPGKTVLSTEKGGRGGQRLAVVLDPDRVEVLDGPHELESLTMGGPVRPGFRLKVRAIPKGPDFHVLAVHLKARPEGQELRRKQWPRLREEVKRATADGETDILVLGDFNTTGDGPADAGTEVRALTAALDPSDLRHLPLEPECTAYWDGKQRDAWKEPAILDHVFVGDLAESLGQDATARPIAHCAQHGCDNLRSTDAYPNRTYALSDHCPVIVDLVPADDDG